MGTFITQNIPQHHIFSMKFVLAIMLNCAMLVQLRRTKTTTEATTAAASVDDDVVTLVKSYIDAGTCEEVSTGDSCGDSAESYYAEFEYNGQRVVINNGIPDHDAENDATNPNPNTRCERWNYIAIPIDPSQADSGVETGMGTTGLAITGAGFFNHESSPDGDVAMANEGTSLDSCFGHSAEYGIYHYHANINCTDAGAATGANDEDQCVHVGYMRDGVPVYGLCRDSEGNMMTSCYQLTDDASTTSVDHVSGTYNPIGLLTSDYEYDDQVEGCNLDEGNGATHPTTGQYSYFMTTGYPWVPIYYNGDSGTSDVCALG